MKDNDETIKNQKITSLTEAIEEYDGVCNAAFLLLISEPKPSHPSYQNGQDVGVWRILEARKIAERHLTWAKSIELKQCDWDALYTYVDKHYSQELVEVYRLSTSEV